LLATTAISALALAPVLAVAQVQSNGPSGAVQEQPRTQEHNAPQGGKPMTTTPGPAAPGKSAQTQTGPSPQTQQKLQGQAQPQQKVQGQAQPQRGQQQLQGQAPRSDETNGGQRVQGQTQQGGQQHVQGRAQQQQASTTGARTQVHVTEQQRTKIHERLAHVKVDRIEHPEFSVSVGAEIPRSVHVEVLPPEIVEIVPEYQGFDYVMVGDEILIIDPTSLQIVAVIPA